jgi:hypothetical protein
MKLTPYRLACRNCVTLPINASILSEVVRQLRVDRGNGFNSGALSIEPFGGSRCRGVLATTYAFSMVFLGWRKSWEASSAEK